MSTSPSPKATLRPSKFIEGPPLTSTAPNLAQTDSQLQLILLEMDSYESSHKSPPRRSKSRTSSSSSSNSNSSHSSHNSTSSLSFFTNSSKRMSHDSSAAMSTSNKIFSGVRASLDMSNPFASSESLGRSRCSIIETTNESDEGSIKDTQPLGSKIKGRLRAWSRGKDDGSIPYATTWVKWDTLGNKIWNGLHHEVTLRSYTMIEDSRYDMRLFDGTNHWQDRLCQMEKRSFLWRHNEESTCMSMLQRGGRRCVAVGGVKGIG